MDGRPVQVPRLQASKLECMFYDRLPLFPVLPSSDVKNLPLKDRKYGDFPMQVCAPMVRQHPAHDKLKLDREVCKQRDSLMVHL